MTFSLLVFDKPLDDWTGARIVVRSEDCPGGVAVVIGGAEEHASLLGAAPELRDALREAINWLEFSTPEEAWAAERQREAVARFRSTLAKASEEVRLPDPPM